MQQQLLTHFKKILLLLTLICLEHHIAAAQQTVSDKFSLTIEPGYLQDNLRWSIAGNIQGGNPNIYSELIWKDLQSVSIGAEAKWNIWKGIKLHVNYSKAYITSGKVTDTDYGADNRGNPVYFGSFKDNKGYSNAFNAMVGYAIAINKKISLTPYLGYSIRKQSLYLLPADTQTPEFLKSTYSVTWYGAVAGIEMKAAVSKKISLQPSFMYNQVKYHGKADWNLIQTFQHPLSFEDFANGYGIEPAVKVILQLSPLLSVYLKSQYFYWDTGKGTDDLYLSAGPTVTTQFNEARRNGWLTGVGLTAAIK